MYPRGLISLNALSPEYADPYGVSRTWLLVGVSLALVAAFFVLREHWPHALGLAPYLLLLACPLLHMFHGHGAHKHGAGATPPEGGKQ
jgi:DUF2933 family protein